MKKHYYYPFIIPIVILISVSTLGYFIHKTLLSSSGEMLAESLELRIQAAEQDWDTAVKHYKRLQNQWSRHKPLWSILINHKEIDKIDEQVQRISTCIQLKKKDDVLQEIDIFRRITAHIPETEQLSFTNIL